MGGGGRTGLWGIPTRKNLGEEAGGSVQNHRREQTCALKLSSAPPTSAAASLGMLRRQPGLPPCVCTCGGFPLRRPGCVDGSFGNRSRNPEMFIPASDLGLNDCSTPSGGGAAAAL